MNRTLLFFDVLALAAVLAAWLDRHREDRTGQAMRRACC